MNMKPTLIALSLLTFLPGCNQILDYFDNMEMAWRDKIAAHKAWDRYEPHYENVEYKKHFGKGFRNGYMNVLGGGSGCQPALPPRWYWKVCFQNPEGQQKIRMWYNGFSHGALVAEQDGLAQYTQIPVAPTIQQNYIPMNAEHHIGLEPEPDPATSGAPAMVPPAPTEAPEPADDIPGLFDGPPEPSEYDPPVTPNSAQTPHPLLRTNAQQPTRATNAQQPKPGHIGARILEAFEIN